MTNLADLTNSHSVGQLNIVSTNATSIDEELTQKTNDTPKKEDRVTLAKEKMNESKNQWVNESIDFQMNGLQNKYIGCVTKRKGITHINKGMPFQDSYGIYSDADKVFTIVTVADGHGDASHDLSEYGSRIACETLCEHIKTILKASIDYFTSADFKISFIEIWKKNVLGFHEENQEKFGEANEKTITRYGTTLLFAFAFKGFYVVGQLGDGGAIILNKESEKCRIHKPLLGKKIGSGVSSLCLENAEAFFDIKIYSETECNGVVLMTDGYYDLWLSDEDLFDASRFFINSLVKNKFDKNKTELDYREKYNAAVDYVSDDISIAVLTNKEPLGVIASNSYEISNVKSSCSRTTCTISYEDKKYKCLYSKNFSTEELTNKKLESELSNLLFPQKSLLINDLRFYLYQESNEEYLSLDDYCERFIVLKQYPLDVIQSISIVKNILAAIDKASELFDKRSLLELSDMIEFSITNGNVVFYWTPQKSVSIISSVTSVFHKSSNLIEIMTKYILNFLAMGKLFYNDNENYKAPKKDSFYAENLSKYPQSYIELLIKATGSKKEFSISSLLKETIYLREKYVYCSNCQKPSLCDNNSCFCGQSFVFFASLKKEADNAIIQISANTFIPSFIEVIKDNNKIGFRNISSKAWSAITKDGSIVSVEPNRVKDISDCVSLKTNNDRYEIEYKKGGN